MSVRVGTGWQTIIADLSMILFMLTASAVTRQSHAAPQASAAAPVVEPAPRSEPTAMWVAGEGAPALKDWLAQQPRDSRQQVTVTATYAPGALNEAMAQARALAAQVGAARAGDARVVVEPGSPAVRVSLGYDAPNARLARPLRKSS
jgi:hypothetical protein